MIISEEGPERAYELEAVDNYKKIVASRHSGTIAPEFPPVVLACTTPEQVQTRQNITAWRGEVGMKLHL